MIRTVLSLALSRHWPVHQLDVNNVFLHGTLTETVYCCQPTGFVDPAHPGLVCHLNKSLYGLKQQYALEILDHAGMTECKSYITSVDTSPKLPAGAGPHVSNAIVYRSWAGALQYLTFTRHQWRV